jgi:hypothetical protein
LKKPDSEGISYKITIITILISILSGFFWYHFNYFNISIKKIIFFKLIRAVVPFFGWSEYSLEGAMISCSVEWNKRTPSVLSYNISIAIFVYFLPLVLFFFTNTKILFLVSIVLIG